jgi:hypothetical protein
MTAALGYKYAKFPLVMGKTAHVVSESDSQAAWGTGFKALHEATHMLTLSLPVDSEQEASVLKRNRNHCTNLMLNAAYVLYCLHLGESPGIVVCN